MEPPSESRRRTFARVAWVVAFYTVAVILWGAFVRATGSGAGCGSHWPLCNGEVLPRDAQTQTLIEFFHRLTSGLCLVGVLAVAVMARKVFSPGHFVRRVAALAVIGVILEALIGAALVLLRLVEHDQSVERAVSISLHLANTSFLVAAQTLTAVGASLDTPRFVFRNRRLKFETWLLIAGFLFLAMSGAITALGDTLFKPTGVAGTLQGDWSQGSHFLQRLRVFHPVFAMLWASALFPWLIGLPERIPDAPVSGDRVRARLSLHLKLLFGLVALQLGLGTANVMLLAPIPLQILHLLVANLVWMDFVIVACVGASLESASSK